MIGRLVTYILLPVSLAPEGGAQGVDCLLVIRRILISGLTGQGGSPRRGYIQLCSENATLCMFSAQPAGICSYNSYRMYCLYTNWR